MYDLQKILLDNYFKKFNIEISKKEFINGIWYYFTKMVWDSEYKEFQYDGYQTAFLLFPERFGIIQEETGKYTEYSN